MAYSVQTPLLSRVILSGPGIAFRLLTRQDPKAVLVVANDSKTSITGTVIYYWKKERRDVAFSGLLHLTMIVNDLQVAWKYGRVFLRINSLDEFKQANLCQPND